MTRPHFPVSAATLHTVKEIPWWVLLIQLYSMLWANPNIISAARINCLIIRNRDHQSLSQRWCHCSDMGSKVKGCEWWQRSKVVAAPSNNKILNPLNRSLVDKSHSHAQQEILSISPPETSIFRIHRNLITQSVCLINSRPHRRQIGNNYIIYIWPGRHAIRPSIHPQRVNW